MNGSAQFSIVRTLLRDKASKAPRRHVHFARGTYLLLILGMVMLPGCFHYTTELTPRGIENLLGSGPSLYNEDVSIRTMEGRVDYAFGEWIGVDSSGKFLVGRREYISRPDTIPLSSVRALYYNLGIIAVDAEGGEYEWDEGEWFVEYGNGVPLALKSTGSDGMRIPHENIRVITLVGEPTIWNVPFYFGIFMLLSFAMFSDI